MNPADRDQAAVDETVADLTKAFGYVEHYMGGGPFCVGAEPSLGDCALAPVLVFMKKALFPVFTGIDDPTSGTGRIATWWQAMQGHDICGATLDEYSDAVDELMKEIRARDRG